MIEDRVAGVTTPPAAPVPLTDEQKVLRSLLGAALGALRYHTEQTRPIQRTNETITAIEHELAAHGITKGQPLIDLRQDAWSKINSPEQVAALDKTIVDFASGTKGQP
jgi:hypothetical protein